MLIENNINKGEKELVVKCDYCEKEFNVTNYTYNRSKTHCCSKDCSNKLRNKKVRVSCKNCGEEIFVIKSRAEKHQAFFCCKKCESTYKYNESHKTISCEVCGKDIILKNSSKQRFCSVECQNKWQLTNLGIDNKNFTRGLINCDYCGEKFYQKQYKIKSQQNNFCSSNCRQKWFGEIYSQQDWYKDNKRKIALSMLEKGIFSNVDTAPQKIINSILQSNNIEFVNEYNCKYYSIDNYLSQYNLMIEVMGDYWHCNPNKYQVIKNNKQILRIPKDKAKHTYIKNKYNIEILYLWEWDIYNNLEVCTWLIEEYINNNGILNNYHSFNYTLKNKELCLKDKIIIPYQDMETIELKNYIVNAQSLDV